MSVAEDFIDEKIDGMASGDICITCGYPFDDFPGCQCDSSEKLREKKYRKVTEGKELNESKTD